MNEAYAGRSSFAVMLQKGLTSVIMLYDCVYYYTHWGLKTYDIITDRGRVVRFDVADLAKCA